VSRYIRCSSKNSGGSVSGGSYVLSWSLHLENIPFHKQTLHSIKNQENKVYLNKKKLNKTIYYIVILWRTFLKKGTTSTWYKYSKLSKLIYNTCFFIQYTAAKVVKEVSDNYPKFTYNYYKTSVIQPNQVPAYNTRVFLARKCTSVQIVLYKQYPYEFRLKINKWHKTVLRDTTIHNTLDMLLIISNKKVHPYIYASMAY